MRGTADGYQVNEDGTGITPAHAGNSEGIKVTKVATGDHPRTCGEQILYSEILA